MIGFNLSECFSIAHFRVLKVLEGCFDVSKGRNFLRRGLESNLYKAVFVFVSEGATSFQSFQVQLGFWYSNRFDFLHTHATYRNRSTWWILF